MKKQTSEKEQDIKVEQQAEPSAEQPAEATASDTMADEVHIII